jgi:hypothetical protein
MMKFYGSLYRLNPEMESFFHAIEELLSKHYKRKLTLTPPPSEDEIKLETSEIGESIIAESSTLKDGQEFQIKSLELFLRHVLNFIGNSYLVKSAALLEGFIWSINLRNAFIGAMCVRQEIEILAASRYVNSLVANEVSGDFVPEIIRMLYGQRHVGDILTEAGEQEIPYKAKSVLTLIQRYDSSEGRQDDEPWLASLYGSLSEIVHPNWKSNIIHMSSDRHFWQLDYSKSPGLLTDTLIDAATVFGRSLDEISKIPPEFLETGLRVVDTGKKK